MSEKLRDTILRYLYEQHQANPGKAPDADQIAKALPVESYAEPGVLAEGVMAVEPLSRQAIHDQLSVMDSQGLVKLTKLYGPWSAEITPEGIEQAERLGSGT